MVDCPCGYGKGIPESQDACPVCGADVTPLHRLRALPRAFYEEGMSLAAEGRLGVALERFSTAVTLCHGDSADAHLALGRAYARRGMYEEAASQYDLGLAVEPGREELRAAKEELEKEVSAAKAADDEARTRAEPPRRRRHFAGLAAALAVALLLGLIYVMSRPRPPQPPDPAAERARVIEEVRRRLAAHPLLAGHGFEVTAAGDAVRLAGTVPTEAHRALAAEVARGAAGGQSEVNFDAVAARGEKPEGAAPQGFRYSVRHGDKLSMLARRFYGDSGKWGQIFEANRGRMKSEHELQEKQVLFIPSP